MSDKPPSAKEIVKAWANFVPKIPLSYYVAYLKALKEKWGHK